VRIKTPLFRLFGCTALAVQISGETKATRPGTLINVLYMHE